VNELYSMRRDPVGDGSGDLLLDIALVGMHHYNSVAAFAEVDEHWQLRHLKV
jgi:hypothetical protein